MTEKSRLLKVKANLKKRQPKFVRQDVQKFKKSSKHPWRKPKGLHSKVGDGLKGYRAKLQGGYRTPKAVRGMNKHGLYPTLVHTVAQIEALDAKVHSLIIGGTVGAKKRLSLLETAKTKGFTVSNLPENASEAIASKRKAAAETKAAREKAKAERMKAAETKSKKADKKADAKETTDEKEAPMEPHAHHHKDQEKKADKSANKKESKE